MTSDMKDDSLTVYTVGHSTHTIEKFLALLREHHISAVADVRSAPSSRYNPQFNRNSLEKELQHGGIKYVFLGRELGGRADKASFYKEGRVQYSLMAKSPAFRRGIERVVEGARRERVALMCAEKEPLECHRTLLVGRALDELGIKVEHILDDGRIESHRDTMLRLLDSVGLPRRDLFLSEAELFAEAIKRQEKRVAYTKAEGKNNGAGDSA